VPDVLHVYQSRHVSVRKYMYKDSELTLTRYIFFVERIHVVRAPFVNRRKDNIYLGCMTMIVIMYSSVAINSYINHVTELRASDGRCHFGIRGIVSIPFTVVNFFTDVVLTGVFFYLLRPVAQIPSIRSFGSKDGHAAHGGTDTPARKDIRTLLWKSIIGSLLIEIPTAANMIQFVITKGEELGMICLTICLVDGKLSSLNMLLLHRELT
jgi:hypothetical protein